MKHYFAENLKKLRKSVDITQDKLAEFIGVTPQTVSKWERAETYPDIETLPVLANYFDVTIDELLGNDKIRTEQAIDKLIADIRETARIGDEAKAVEMAREGYKKYPYSYKMMDYYCTALQSYDVVGDYPEERKAEIRRLAELILDGCTVDEYRYNAIENMCHFCHQDEKSEWYRKIPAGIQFTQEIYMEDLHPISTDEGIELRQKNMLELLWWFINEATEMCGWWFNGHRDGDPKSDADIWIAVNEMMLAIYSCLFRDGDYLDYAGNTSISYYCMAEAHMTNGNKEKALECLENAAKFCVMNESVPKYAKHTSYLVDHIVYDESKLGLKGSCGSPEYYLYHMNQPLYDSIRSDDRFKKVEHILKTCPVNERRRDPSDFEWLKTE